MKTTSKSKIESINLREPQESSSSVITRRDRDTALHDLITENVFQPIEDNNGPYHIDLSIEDNRLIFRVTDKTGQDLSTLVLSLKPYRRLIKDYFIIVNSYDEAVRDGKPSRIEAIDMGRRGLHNEGAELLMERLESKIYMDMNTARRIFTLICVLHNDKALVWR